MKPTVPNTQAAVIEPRKLFEYLLAPDHPVGRNKARVFTGCGYDRENTDGLVAALKHVLVEGQLVEVVESFYGSKYIVEGTVRCSNGGFLDIRTVWIIEKDTEIPRFVTAYPV